MRLRVTSYNLLAPLFVRVEGQPYSSFGHASAEDLDWSNRQPRIVRLLERSNPDLLCLQEVEYEPAEGDAAPYVPPAWLRAFGEAGDYAVFAEAISPGDWRRRADRNLRKAGREACTGLVTLARRSLGPQDVQAASRGLILRLHTDGERVTLANVHLEGHPAKGAERVKQLRGILNRAGQGAPSHVLVVGDFNTSAEPLTPVGRLLEGLQDMRLVALGPTWGGAPGQPRAVDQVMHPSSLEVEEAKVDLSNEDIELGMPNRRSPSDHALVDVVFRVASAARALQVPPPAARPAATSPAPLPDLPSELRSQLEAAWRQLLDEAPAQPSGPPTEAERAALQVFKKRKKAFLSELASDAQRAFVKSLR